MGNDHQNAGALVLKTALRSLVPINVLSREAFEKFSEHIELETAPAGTVLFHYGDTSNQVAYLLSGEVILKDVNNSVVQSVRGGTERARYPLAHELPREMTALATTNIAYVDIDMHQLNDLMSEIHSVDHQIGDIRVNDIRDTHDDDWITFALQSSQFEYLPPANLQVLLTHLKKVPVKKGEIIINQGEIANYYYFIRFGRCQVTRKLPGKDKSVLLAELKAGDGFGEEALIAYTKRNASVTMLSDGLLMRLTNSDFKELMERPLLKSISRTEMDNKILQGACILDVRSPSDFETSHLPNSRNIPYHTFREVMSSLDPEQTYVTCSNTGKRSAVASFLLRQRGIDSYYLNHQILSILNDNLTRVAHDTSAIEVEYIPENNDITEQFQTMQELNKLRSEYKELQQRYQNERLEVASKIDQASSAHNKNHAIEMAGLKSEKEDAQRELASYQAMVKKETLHLEEEVEAIQELEATRLEALNEVEKLHAELKLAKQEADKLKFEASNLAALHNARLKEEKKLADLESRKLELEQIVGQRGVLQKELDELSTELTLAKQEAGKINSEAANLAALHNARLKEEKKLAGLESSKLELEQIVGQRGVLQKELDELSAELNASRQEMSNIHEQIHEKTEQLSKLESQHAEQKSIAKSNEDLRSQLIWLNKEAKAAQAEVEEARHKLELENTRCEELASKAAEYESLSESHAKMQSELATLKTQLETVRQQARAATHKGEDSKLESELNTLQAREEAVQIKAEAEQIRLKAAEEAIQLKAEAEQARLQAQEDIIRTRAEAERIKLHTEGEVARIKNELAKLQRQVDESKNNN
jgi:CRP-like cAMP-binding protein/chromosome segregation ATPase